MKLNTRLIKRSEPVNVDEVNTIFTLDALDDACCVSDRVKGGIS